MVFSLLLGSVCFGTNNQLPSFPNPVYDNGVFQGPTVGEFLELSQAETASALGGFVRDSNRSYLNTAKGQAELRAIALEILPLMRQSARVISIGRSGTALEAYLNGIVTRHPEGAKTFPVVEELPFSCHSAHIKNNLRLPFNFELSREQITGLRNHLERNGLSPLTIIASPKPILFFDFVYSGTGVAALIQLIFDWAEELKIESSSLSAKITFFGMFPAYRLVYNNYETIRHDNMRDGLGALMPTKEYMENEARSRPISLPNGFYRWIPNVHEFRISSQLYDYCGNSRFTDESGALHKVEPVQESFTPSHWAVPTAISTTPKNRIKEHLHEFSTQELVTLFQAGQKHSTLLCESAF